MPTNYELPDTKSFPAWKSGMTVKRTITPKDENNNPYLDEEGNIVKQEKRVGIKADKRSQMNHLHMSNKLQRHTDLLWKHADKCWLWRQPVEQEWDDKNKVYLPFKKYPNTNIDITERANRVLSGHTLKTMASGAVAAVNAQLSSDAKLLRISDGASEDNKYPMLPQISVGAAYAIEAAFIAYVQEIFSVAYEIQKAHHKKHRKVTAKGCQVAAEIVNKKLAGATSFVPISISMRRPLKQKKSKGITKGKDN